MASFMFIGLLLTCASAFQNQFHLERKTTLKRSQLFAKGFAEKKVREKSATKIEKERAASAYEAAKSKGIPEYRIHVKPARDSGDNWIPVGCVTVPRSESVAQAIFANLDPLKNAAFATDPQLRKVFDDEGFEYGYNLAVFPDDPVRLADPADAQKTTNPFSKWVKDLTSPVNAKDAAAM